MTQKYPALEYRDNMEGKFDNGVWEIECLSWDEFISKTERVKDYKYFWRGQDCLKELKPSIYRDFTPDTRMIKQHLLQFKKDMPMGDTLYKFLKPAEANNNPNFEIALSTYYNMIFPHADPNNPKENYIEDFIDTIYWAIGQHHGLKTPLLDWTADPFKALFFAFCKRQEKNNKRVIFGLAEKNRLLLKNKVPKKRYIELLNNLDFVHTISESTDSPSSFKEIVSPMFARMKAQNGLFSKSLQNKSVEKHAQRCYSYYESHRNQKIVFLIKILFHNEVRKDFLKQLEGKKITYKTMYPDLFGAVSYCNCNLEQDSKA